MILPTPGPYPWSLAWAEDGLWVGDFPQPPDAKLNDRWGQEVARFRKPSLKPGERSITRMRVRANIYDVMYHLFPEKAGSLKDIPADLRSRFLADDDKYRLKDPVIQDAVKEAVGKNDRQSRMSLTPFFAE